MRERLSDEAIANVRNGAGADGRIRGKAVMPTFRPSSHCRKSRAVVMHSSNWPLSAAAHHPDSISGVRSVTSRVTVAAPGR